jgi:methionyl-tRNA formyltransferase
MSLKIVYMGTPEFAVAPLKELTLSHHRVVAVVTGPDVRSGRGRKMRLTPVKELATRLGLAILTPESLKSPELLDELREFKADIFVVVAFRILPRSLYSLPRLGSINLHGSLLPRYRGAAPIQRALMDGAEETGLTVFSLADKVDTGGIVLQKNVSISPVDNFTTLASRMSALSGSVLIEALDLLESGDAQLETQDSSLATAAAKITAADREIDWDSPAVSIVNQIRGLAEAPGAFTNWRGKRLKVLGAKVCQPDRPLTTGEVTIAGKKICIGAGNGSALETLTLQPEGKKKMNAVDIINGQFLREGEKLGEVARNV